MDICLLDVGEAPCRDENGTILILIHFFCRYDHLDSRFFRHGLSRKKMKITKIAKRF